MKYLGWTILLLEIVGHLLVDGDSFTLQSAITDFAFIISGTSLIIAGKERKHGSTSSPRSG